MDLQRQLIDAIDERDRDAVERLLAAGVVVDHSTRMPGWPISIARPNTKA